MASTGAWTRALSSQDLSVEEHLITRYPLAAVLEHAVESTRDAYESAENMCENDVPEKPMNERTTKP